MKHVGKEGEEEEEEQELQVFREHLRSFAARRNAFYILSRIQELV
jgi:hypothetical protein